MIHYHGTPITPLAALYSLAGSAFCVSIVEPKQLRRVHEIGRGVMLDNGAFSAWTKRRPTDWPAFYRWCEPWLSEMTWAVIPDLIEGDESANDALIKDWPHGAGGAPVWHMHESINRLCHLAERWPRVCIGSSGAFRIVGSTRWHGRMVEAMNTLCGNGPPPTALHLLRGLSMAGSIYPLASADSTDIGRNHKRGGRSAATRAKRWEAQRCPNVWIKRAVQYALPI